MQAAIDRNRAPSWGITCGYSAHPHHEGHVAVVSLGDPASLWQRGPLGNWSCCTLSPEVLPQKQIARLPTSSGFVELSEYPSFLRAMPKTSPRGSSSKKRMWAGVRGSNTTDQLSTSSLTSRRDRRGPSSPKRRAPKSCCGDQREGPRKRGSMLAQAVAL